MKRTLYVLAILSLVGTFLYAGMDWKYTKIKSSNHSASDTVKQADVFEYGIKDYDTAIYVIESKGSIKFDSVFIDYLSPNGNRFATSTVMKDSTVTDTSKVTLIIVPISLKGNFPKATRLKIRTVYKPLKATTYNSYFTTFWK